MDAAQPGPSAVLAAFGLPAATAVRRMAGNDATVWRAELADRRTVAVRVLRSGVSAAAEAAMLRLAGQHGHPVPELLAGGTHDGHDVLVTTWCRGSTIGDLLGDEPDDGAAHRLGLLFGRSQAELHRPLDDAGRVLCHLDFQPFNVLADRTRVTGIIDWANARLDDAREDLAWTSVVLPLGEALRPDLAGRLAAFADGWRSGYAQRRPMPTAGALRPFLARAAARQLAEWEPRGAAGACPAGVVEAARRLASRWA